MTHAEILNSILSHTCPRDTDGDKRTFTFDLCCEEVTINARLVKPDMPAEYEIDSVTFKFGSSSWC